MKLIENRLVATYEHEGYIIEVYDMGDTWEGWLHNPQYGVKSLIFGAPKKQKVEPKTTTLELFIEMVSANIDDSIEYYHEEYED